MLGTRQTAVSRDSWHQILGPWDVKIDSCQQRSLIDLTVLICVFPPAFSGRGAYDLELQVQYLVGCQKGMDDGHGKAKERGCRWRFGVLALE